MYVNIFFIVTLFKTPNISDKLLNLNLKEFLDEHLTLNPQNFILKNKIYTINEKWWLAEQIKLYGKGSKKINTFLQNYCWLTSKAFEQCSSETTANFKATLFKGNTLLDLSGGLGVDDLAFCKVFKQVISIDLDEELNKAVNFNFKKIGINNFIRITADAETYLNNYTENLDLIYIDADRRAGKEKSVLFTDGSPNVLNLIQKGQQLADHILIKLSPLVDITYCIKQLPNLSNIYLVEFNGELKEVLCVLSKTPTIAMVNLVWLTYNNTKILPLKPNHKNITEFKIPQIGNVLFEPSAAIRKADASLEIAELFNLNKLNNAGTYLLGFEPNSQFEGRQFLINYTTEFSSTNLTKLLKQHQITEANIACRDFVLKPEEIHKKYKIKTGGNNFLFFTTLCNGEKYIILGTKVNP